jgi:anti-anti-sigma factor
VDDQAGPFEAELRRHGSTVTLCLSGELVVDSVEKFQSALVEAGSEPLELLVIDLQNLDFIDSTGLRTIVASQAYALGQGYALQIVRGRQQVDEVFQITKLDRALPMVEAPPTGASDEPPKGSRPR